VSLGRVWLLFLVNFLIQWGILVVLDNFMWPPLYGPVMAFVGLVGDQYATGFSHYPGHFMILPYVFDWAKLIIGFIIEGPILGAAALILYEDHFDSPEEEKTPLRVIFSSWLYLSLAWALMNGLMLLISVYLPGYFESWMAGSPRRILAYQFVLLPAVYVALLSLQFFVIPRIAIFGENVWQALKRGMLISLQNPVSTFCLAALVLTGPVIMSFFTGQPGLIVDKFRPELVYWALVVSLFVEMIANFLWMGTAARFLVEIEE